MYLISSLMYITKTMHAILINVAKEKDTLRISAHHARNLTLDGLEQLVDLALQYFLSIKELSKKRLSSIWTLYRCLH